MGRRSSWRLGGVVLGLALVVALCAWRARGLGAAPSRAAVAAADSRPERRTDRSTVVGTALRGRVPVAASDGPAASAVGPTPESRLAVVARSQDLGERLRALHELATEDGVEVDAALAAAAHDASLPTRVRRQAALLLANRGGDVAFEALARLLVDSDPAMRLAGVQALGVQRRPDAVERLAAMLLDEPSRAVGRALVQALGSIGTAEAIRELSRLTELSEPPPGRERDVALASLAAVSNQAAVPAMADWLVVSVDPDVRRALTASLSRAADPACSTLLMQIAAGDSEPATRCEAMQGLGLLGDRRALPILRERETFGTASERSFARSAIHRIESQ